VATLAIWLWTLGALAVMFGIDFYLAIRKPRKPTTREASLWVSFYIILALAFAILLRFILPAESSGQFVAGWLTEYSLSIDNLFVFLIIFSRLRVPEKFIQSVLLIGIALALLMRGFFITAGAFLIHRFTWTFFLFGAFLLLIAVRLLYQGGGDEDWHEGRVVTFFRKRNMGILGIAIIAIGTTDLFFALDSIPAIFGITKDPYLVFTSNAFALMGLRQIYVLLGSFLGRLVHLSKGLAVILGFIGIKMISEGLNGPKIGLSATLAVIITTLLITTIVSLKSKPKIEI
jgi:tellurite resistance protein TerC